MISLSDELPTERAECPKCGYRVEVSAVSERLLDPKSKCVHKDGPTRCPDLRADLSEVHTLLSAPQNNLILAKRAKRLERASNSQCSPKRPSSLPSKRRVGKGAERRAHAP